MNRSYPQLLADYLLFSRSFPAADPQLLFKSHGNSENFPGKADKKVTRSFFHGLMLGKSCLKPAALPAGTRSFLLVQRVFPGKAGSGGPAALPAALTYENYLRAPDTPLKGYIQGCCPRFRLGPTRRTHSGLDRNADLAAVFATPQNERGMVK